MPGVRGGLVRYSCFLSSLEDIRFGCAANLRFEVRVRIGEDPRLPVVYIGLILIQFVTQDLGPGHTNCDSVAHDADVAILQFSDWSGVIAVAVIYGAGQVIEGFFLTPRLVGERIGLNPLAVIFALLAFGQLFGFVGVLLALPASAVLMVAFRHLKRHYLRSSFYNA